MGGIWEKAGYKMAIWENWVNSPIFNDFSKLPLIRMSE